MGLYDEIICDYPLPGNPPEFARKPGHQFQTKDLDCELTTYKITSYGRLVDSSKSEVNSGHFTGTIDFYSGNSRGGVGDIDFTEHGEDAEWVEYRAIFDDGKLTSIMEFTRTRKPALPVSVKKCYTGSTPENQAARKIREAEDLTGRMMFLWHGCGEPASGHTVAVVYSGPLDWVVQNPEHKSSDGRYRANRLEIISRRMRDRWLWDSLEAAQSDHDERRTDREREMTEYRRLMEERT